MRRVNLLAAKMNLKVPVIYKRALIHINLASLFFGWGGGTYYKQCRIRSDATEYGINPRIGNGLVQLIRLESSFGLNNLKLFLYCLLALI